VIDRGVIRKRKEMPSKKFRDEFGHTPLSIEEELPWKCHRLVIGTGAYGRLAVMKEVKLEAERRHLELVIVPTREAIRLIEKEVRSKRHSPRDMLGAHVLGHSRACGECSSLPFVLMHRARHRREHNNP
jgi:hypothetical protein